MWKVGLQLKARLENVTKLTPIGEDFRWYIKVKCINCGEISEHYQYVSLEESTPIKGSRGHANLVMKCRLCGRENSLDIIRESIKEYNIEDTEDFKTIVVFDCRGIEPVEFDPRIGWSCSAHPSGSSFQNVPLIEKEWCEYDDIGKVEVGIYDLDHKFIVVR